MGLGTFKIKVELTENIQYCLVGRFPFSSQVGSSAGIVPRLRPGARQHQVTTTEYTALKQIFHEELCLSFSRLSI